MAYNICSSRQCNVCLVLKTENASSVKETLKNSTAAYTLARPNLSKCNGCLLVLYCSPMHQKMDWPLHRDMCRAIQKLMTTFNVKHPYLLNGQPRSAEEMERSILQVKFVLRSILGRSLQYHEEELTSFPQFCVICYCFRRLQICARCQAVSYCSEAHALEDEVRHNRNCGLLQLYYTPYKSQSLSMPVLELCRRVPDLHKMDLYEAFTRVTLKQIPTQPTSSIKSYQLFSAAADFSCIGTICYALEFTKMRCYDNKKFVIFIVGAVFEKKLWFQDIHTKFFFLQYPQISQLCLFFIGPEVEGDETNEVRYTFQGQERRVQSVTYSGTIQDFNKVYSIKPCLIVSYNCGFSEHMDKYQQAETLSKLELAIDASEVDSDNAKTVPQTELLKSREVFNPLKHTNVDANADGDATVTSTTSSSLNTWPHGIVDILLTFGVPIVFTSYTYHEALFDYSTVLRIAQSAKEPIHVTQIFNIAKNPYRDFRPLRLWRLSSDDEIFYRNGYVQAIRTRFES